MYQNELRMSRNVDEQPPGSTLQACRHRGSGLVLFVHAPDAPHWPLSLVPSLHCNYTHRVVLFDAHSASDYAWGDSEFRSSEEKNANGEVQSKWACVHPATPGKTPCNIRNHTIRSVIESDLAILHVPSTENCWRRSLLQF